MEGNEDGKVFSHIWLRLLQAGCPGIIGFHLDPPLTLTHSLVVDPDPAPSHLRTPNNSSDHFICRLCSMETLSDSPMASVTHT